MDEKRPENGLKKVQRAKERSGSSSAPGEYWLYVARVRLARAIIRRIAQGLVCSPFRLMTVKAPPEIFSAFCVPAADGFFINWLCSLLIGEFLADPAHEVGQFAAGSLRPALEPCRCSPAFLFQHGAKPQPFKKGFPHYANGPASIVIALLVLRSGLRDFQKSGFLY